MDPLKPTSHDRPLSPPISPSDPLPRNPHISNQRDQPGSASEIEVTRWDREKNGPGDRMRVNKHTIVGVRARLWRDADRNNVPGIVLTTKNEQGGTTEHNLAGDAAALRAELKEAGVDVPESDHPSVPPASLPNSPKTPGQPTPQPGAVARPPVGNQPQQPDRRM